MLEKLYFIAIKSVIPVHISYFKLYLLVILSKKNGEALSLLYFL